MLPLKPFTVLKPANLAELAALLHHVDNRTKFMAGGTDLLPNLKHGLYDVAHIISLRRLKELDFVLITQSHITLGALTKLSHVAEHGDIQCRAPALAHASSRIASPQIRNMGTVGGNICLDTRCLYFNQTEFWRSALGFCLKKDGCACHVVKTGKRCVAAASNDLATVLLAYDAMVTIQSPHGTYTMPLDDFYTAHGEKNHVLPLGHVVTNVRLALNADSYAGFYKVRMRDSIDFPLLSVAVCFQIDDGKLVNGRLVINALVAKPKCLVLADFAHLRYNQDLVHSIADFAHKKCHPQTNLAGDVGFRKHMVAVAVKRAFDDALRIE